MGLPVVEKHDKVLVVRDDIVPGGTKQEALLELLPQMGYHELCFSSPVWGYAQVALAMACRDLGLSAVVFCAKRKELAPLTRKAKDAGAKIVEVPHGRLSVVRARAREHCARTGGLLFPMGFDLPEMRAAFKRRALSTGLRPREVWCVAGSGALCRALAEAWPDAQVHAVRIGFPPNVGRARLWQAPERFEEPASGPRPPFPSCANYDAKAWRFVTEHARPGALFWNVAA